MFTSEPLTLSLNLVSLRPLVSILYTEDDFKLISLSLRETIFKNALLRSFPLQQPAYKHLLTWLHFVLNKSGKFFQ